MSLGSRRRNYERRTRNAEQKFSIPHSAFIIQRSSFCVSSRRRDTMTTTQESLRSRMISVSDLEWQELQPGIRMKNLWEHPETKRRALMTRIGPGTRLPLHRHAGDELIFVIEGANADESGVVTPGNLSYRPNGCVHTVTTKNGATALAFVWGRTEMV